MKYTREVVWNMLQNEAEEKFAAFSLSLLGEGKENTKVIGVRLPRLRRFSKEIAKTEGKEYLDDTELTKEDSLEEILLYGMVIGEMKAPLQELFPYIRRYVRLIDNWSTCDSFCTGLKIAKKEPDLMWDFLREYLKSDQEYDIRFAVVMLMLYYMDDEHIDELLQIYDGISHEGYYVKMGVAWGISMCLVSYWDKTIAYMLSEENKLDDFTFIKALQKGRESNRLTKEQKEYLKELMQQRKGQISKCEK